MPTLRRVLVFFVFSANLAQAASFAVDTTLDSIDANPGDGVCADAGGACSLRAAVQEANALAGADTIELPAGTYSLTIAGADENAAAGDLDITDDLAIHGAGTDASIIDGNAIDRVLDVIGGAARTVELSQVTIRNGAILQGGTNGGAGIRVDDGAHLALEDVVIRDHRTTNTFAGIAIDSAGCVAGTRVRILDNRDTAETGSANAVAAVRLDGANACLDLSDSEISGNRADYAGAIESDLAPITLRRSLVSDNEARFAGALLLNTVADTLLENVTISGNRGIDGAVLNDGGSRLWLVHCTVTGNGPYEGITSNVGGLDDVHGGFGLTFLSNTIVAGNGPGFLADDCAAATSVGGGNIVGSVDGCRFDDEPTDQLDVDPELGPLAENGGATRTHVPGAAAIDRAEAAACVATDQRGVARPLDGDGDGAPACDVGAVEIARDLIFASGFE